MNETSGLYIFNWYQIAITSLILGILVGYQIGKLTRDFNVLYAMVKKFFKKDLAQKTKVLYISNYKRKKESK